MIGVVLILTVNQVLMTINTHGNAQNADSRIAFRVTTFMSLMKTFSVEKNKDDD